MQHALDGKRIKLCKQTQKLTQCQEWLVVNDCTLDGDSSGALTVGTMVSQKCHQLMTLGHQLMTFLSNLFFLSFFWSHHLFGDLDGFFGKRATT